MYNPLPHSLLLHGAVKGLTFLSIVYFGYKIEVNANLDWTTHCVTMCFINVFHHSLINVIDLHPVINGIDDTYYEVI
jgi:hypothetical protein